jgi:hypothetical protein
LEWAILHSWNDRTETHKFNWVKEGQLKCEVCSISQLDSVIKRVTEKFTSWVCVMYPVIYPWVHQDKRFPHPTLVHSSVQLINKRLLIVA